MLFKELKLTLPRYTKKYRDHNVGDLTSTVAVYVDGIGPASKNNPNLEDLEVIKVESKPQYKRAVITVFLRNKTDTITLFFRNHTELKVLHSADELYNLYNNWLIANFGEDQSLTDTLETIRDNHIIIWEEFKNGSYDINEFELSAYQFLEVSSVV